VVLSGGDRTGLNFTGAINTYSVSGFVRTPSGVGISGVTVSFYGGYGEVTTAATGAYLMSGLPDGTYTAVCSKPGYTFSPSSLSVTVSGSDKTGQDFQAQVNTYSISGFVRTSDGVGIGDAKVEFPNGYGEATTDVSGAYSKSGFPDGAYTVTCSKSGYTFSPSALSVAVGGADKTNQDFTDWANTYTISGFVRTPAGPTGSRASRTARTP
jgi:hypothetical protein